MESGFQKCHPVQRMQLIQLEEISPARRITLSQHTPDKEVPRPWKTLGNKKELTFPSHEEKKMVAF